MTTPVVSIPENFISGLGFNTTALADGSLLAVYARTGTGGGFQIVKQFLNADGTAATAPQVIFSRTDGMHLSPMAVCLSDGRFVVAWTSDDSGLGDSFVRYQIFKADGTAASSILALGGPESLVLQSGLTALADGGFAISYSSGSSWRSAFFNAAGAMSQDAALDTRAFGSNDVATLKNGSYVTVATTFLDAGGVDLKAYIRKPTGEVTTKTLIHADDMDGAPEVTVLADGNFLVVWREQTSTTDTLKAHLYDADGNPVGEELSFGTGSVHHTVKALANGGFALAYTTLRPNGTTGDMVYDLNLATYSATGASVDSPTIVKAGITDSLIDPSIEVLKDGRYVLSYERGHYQIFDPRPAAVSWSGTNASEQYGGTRFEDHLNGSGGNDKLYGFDGNDVLNGGTGNDYLKGGMGADTLNGGAGNDIYYVDSRSDRIVETSTGGTADLVYASASYTLSSYVEKLYAQGSASISLTGNAQANTIKGNGGANKINGGYGKDTLYGGAGKDVFVFSTKPSSSNLDKIADYNVSYDSIYLENAVFTKLGSGSASSPKKLSSSAFWKGSKAHDASDRIIYDAAKGYLYYDADGTGASKQVLIATLAKSLKMTYGEFFVI